MFRLAVLVAVLALASPSGAQPVDLPVAPARTSDYPPGVKVIRTKAGPVYAGPDGRTLYGLDMRTLLRAGPDPAQYCRDACAENWEAVLAPAGSKANVLFPRSGGGRRAAAPEGFMWPEAAPDWSIIEGPAGMQWVYKGWHMVFARKGDGKGSTAYDGAERMSWNTLKFVPPQPDVKAPAGVKPLWHEGAWVLADKDDQLLFTAKCSASCGWMPLPGPMASAGKGDWQVVNAGDRPQWSYRGKPVFVLDAAGPSELPKSARLLKP